MHVQVRTAMTTDVVTVNRKTPFPEILRLLQDREVSALPVVDDGRVVGVVSEADLLRKEEYKPGAGFEYHPSLRTRLRHRLTREGDTRTKASGTTAETLMTAPAITVGADASVVAAARLLDRFDIKRLPVVDEEGRLLGIVSRRDVLRTFVRPDEDIMRDIRDDAIIRALWPDPNAFGISVDDGVVTLAGDVDRRTHAIIAGQIAAAVDGVVDVVNRLQWHFDDIMAQRQAFGP